MTSGQATPKPQSNYLSRAARDTDERAHQRRQCSVLFNVFFPTKGIRRTSQAQLRVLNICEGGLSATSRRQDIPDHFYISIGDKQFLIACAIVERNADVLHIRFLNELPTAFVNVVASLRDPLALLEKIRPALYGLEDLVH